MREVARESNEAERFVIHLQMKFTVDLCKVMGERGRRERINPN